MFHRLLCFGLLLSTLSVHAAWHQVFIPVASKTELRQVVDQLGGIDPCGSTISDAGIELTVNDVELNRLQVAGLNPQILVADLEAMYAERLGASRNYGAYHTYSEGMAELQQLQDDFPSIVSEPIVIGTTLEGNSIWAFKISDNPEVDEDEPEVFYNSYIHAREAITIEVILHFVHHLTDNYGSDPRVTSIVDERELWFVPFMNPDGVLYNESTNPNGGGMWRKNRSVNGDGSRGVDLNRNFGYQWGFDDSGSSPFGTDVTYRGPAAFSEPATQVIRDFVNSREFTAAITYHSYSNLYIYPWGYDEIHVPEPDHSAFTLMTGLMSDVNGYSPGTAWELLYSVNGGTDDWLYGATDEHAKILAITPEVGTGSDGFWPSESRIPALVAENLEPNLIFAEIAGNPWSMLPPAPPLLDGPAIAGDSYLLTWSTPSPQPDNLAVAYELRELSGLSTGDDDFGDTSNWGGAGASFVLSSSRSASAPTSFYGGTGHNRNAISELAQPVAAMAGQSISFQTWYDIESNWDYAYVEISTDGQAWSSIAGNITTTSDPNGNNDGHGITGSSGGWITADFPLDDWAGQDLLVRLRYETDQGVLEEGIYVDDFSPIRSFASEIVLDDAITGENYLISAQTPGDYWYKLRAVDAEGDLSAWSNLLPVSSEGGEDLSGPTYAHTPLSDTTDDQGPWPVQVQINDGSGVAEAWLDYRAVAGPWTSIAMLPARETWEATIPGPQSYGSLVEYRVRAVDGSDNSNESTSETWSFTILPPVGLEACQDFETGFADWTVVTHDSAGNTWTLDSDPEQGQVARIEYSGVGQEDHASLVSPVLDCSQQGAVVLEFWQRLRLGYSGAFTDALVWGSVDGGQTWTYLLAEWHDDDMTGEFTVEGIENLDLSSWAAGQPQVALRFEYHALYDWYWMLDDICVTGTLDVVPDPVALQIQPFGNGVLLSWNPSPGAHDYNVYVSDSPWSDFQLLATTAGTSWEHAGVASLELRCYLVRAASASPSLADPDSIPRIDPLGNARAAAPIEKLLR